MPAQLPPPNPGILDHAEPTREGPMDAWLVGMIVCAFVLYAVLNWLIGAR